MGDVTSEIKRQKRVVELDHLECMSPWFNKAHELLLEHSYWSVHMRDISDALSIVDKVSTTLSRAKSRAKESGDELRLGLCNRIELESLRMVLGMIDKVREQTEEYIEMDEDAKKLMLDKEEK